MKLPVVKIRKLEEKAIVPSRGHDTDSGWDLTVVGIHKIKGDTIFFKTGLQVEPPTGHYFEVYPRSSISELPFMLANSVGIIDESYRGELIVAIRVLHPLVGNGTERDQYPGGMVKALEARPASMSEVAGLIMSKKPRIAQMILRKRLDFTIQEVDEDLSATERSSGGFGSTGQ
jgi:dUTP pyrophosphatase